MHGSEDRDKLRDIALVLGFDLFGIADVRDMRAEFALPERLRDRFDRAISLGKRLNDAVLEDIDDHPTALYFHHYRQVNAFLDRGAMLLADRIQARGHLALPIPASQILNWEKQTAHLSHKHVAARAGVGWFGRNNLLVTPRFGARVRLVTVLTDMPLEAGVPLAQDCGSCRACIAACPAGAIKDRREEFNHLACYEKLKDFQKQRLVSQFICGVCVKACRGPK